MLKYIPKKKFLLLTGDIILIYCAYLLSPIIRFRVFFFEPLDSLQGVFVVLFIYIFCFYIADLYNFDTKFIHLTYIYRFLFAIVISIGLTSLVFFFFPKIKAGRGVVVINAILICILTYLWRLFFEIVFKKYVQRQKRMLIIGAGKAGNNIYKLLRDNQGYKIVGFIDDDPKKHGIYNSLHVLGDFTVIDNVVKSERIDNIFVAIKNLNNENLLKTILSSKLNGINVYDLTSFYEEILGKIQVEHLNDAWLLNMSISGVKKSIYNRRIKRLNSILLSISLLIISSPILILSAIAIKLDSKGPIFYRQKRIGLNRKPFEAIKLRTMEVEMEKDRRFAGEKNDPRITRVGKVLRFFRIDEIPQMWNVFKGEMSFIGPRALMLEEVEEFESKVPYFTIRHCVKPGITGWAQVNYHHGVSEEDALEKLKYDLFYIKNLSPFLDFHILLRTIRVVLFGKGAR